MNSAIECCSIMFFCIAILLHLEKSRLQPAAAVLSFSFEEIVSYLQQKLVVHHDAHF